MLNMIESVNNSIESHDNSESQLSFTSSESTDGSPVPWNSNGTIHSTASIIKDAVSLITRLDDFNVIHIASGFFSTVFKVTHKSTHKVMVLKMNKLRINRANALKEIELLNKLNHQNIVSFMGSVVHEGQLHPLLEYIDGGTLESLIKMYYSLNERSDEVKQFNLIAQDVANGMDYLHSNGLIHRDLTSKNVLLRKLQNQLFQSVISDFGFATHEPPDGSTVQLSTVGSPYWMAPECIRGDWYNHKCDVFSYGIICCEMNWRVPSDPDYLQRNHRFEVAFDKLSSKYISTLLGKIAQFCCQGNPNVRPEFYEILQIFEEQNNESNSLFNQINAKPKFEHSVSVDDSDIFEQHLIRRRNSQYYSHSNHRFDGAFKQQLNSLQT